MPNGLMHFHTSFAGKVELPRDRLGHSEPEEWMERFSAGRKSNLYASHPSRHLADIFNTGPGDDAANNGTSDSRVVLSGSTSSARHSCTPIDASTAHSFPVDACCETH